MTQVESNYARITDEMVARVRSRIGVRHTPRNIWNEEATRDAIKHWAWGIGDDNPLWLDEEYAAKGPYGGLIAPPTFPYSVNHGPLGPGSQPSKGGGLPGIHGLHLYEDWEFFQPIRVGTKLSPSEYLAEVEEKSGRYAQRMLLEKKEVLITDDQGVVVAKNAAGSMKTERGARPEASEDKYANISKWVYTPDEIARIEADYANETRRGAEPRYWEDIQVGDDLGSVTKGPLTVMSMITFWMGWGCIFGMTDKIAHDYMRLHPKANQPHLETNIPDFSERAHWAEDRLTQDIGFPLGYDIGVQRISWFSHLLTNWQGDAGFLRRLRVSLRAPNWLGDTTWIRGRVSATRIEGEEHLVDCELWGETQRGTRHSEGIATVRLPSRSE